jgi:integrase
MSQQDQLLRLKRTGREGEALWAYRYRVGGRDSKRVPAQIAAGIDPLRRIYDLRHTFATFALRAGISTFDLSRYMGASLTMIDRHYGHLARDGREHTIRLLDELSAGQRPPWTLVDAAWTPKPSATVSRDNGNTA